jgi:hypothetical protein
MADRKIFISKVSFEEAKQQAWKAGYQPISYVRNSRNEFIVFGRRMFML